MAYFSVEEEKNPILEIQRILRTIDFFDGVPSTIRLTGTYNEETRDHVRRFQEKYGLPVTGIVDNSSWNLLQTVDRAIKESQNLAKAVYLLPRSPEYTISPGLTDDVIYIIQHMVNVISHEYDGISPIQFTGKYDEPTENAIKEFQRINLLENNGIIDSTTFNRLADEYERINSYNQ